MTIFEALPNLNKEEFISWAYKLYWKGIADGQKQVDDTPWILNRLADWPVDKIDEIE